MWCCWIGSDHFFLEMNITSSHITETVAREVVFSKSKSSCGPRHDCQHAMWPPENHEFHAPALECEHRAFVLHCNTIYVTTLSRVDFVTKMLILTPPL